MYLSRVHLANWRSYADATFEFHKPTERKSVVLIGAMNGHGKTSFLVSLYLGLAELSEQMRQYLNRAHSNAGGRRRTSEKQAELNEKLKLRDGLNARIGKLEGENENLEKQKEELERERARLTEDLARRGGAFAQDTAEIQADHVRAEREKTEAEKAVSDAVKILGVALAVSRMAIPVKNRLRSEELLEAWEGLKHGTLAKKEAVLTVAMPEPPESDPLLGNLSQEVRRKVKERFAKALERIYEPPDPHAANEYLLGYVKGEMRDRLIQQLNQVQMHGSNRIRALAKRLKEAREAFEDTKARLERVQNMPQETQQLKDQLSKSNEQIGNALTGIGAKENEIRKLKADLHDLNVEIGGIQDFLARLEPEQKRVAVAERINFVLGELNNRLKPMTSSRSEDFVTKNFLKIADKRFRNGHIRLPTGGVPEIQFDHSCCRTIPLVIPGVTGAGCVIRLCVFVFIKCSFLISLSQK